jgi:hypothetical protein
MTKKYRNLTFKTTGAEIRTAVYMDKEHVVVPVVALMEGVIHPVNADNPELVLAEQLNIAPQGWNGRPVVGDHPQRNGQRVSANEPSVLEAESFGLIFNAMMEDKKLKVEAWLDPQRAEAVGRDAINVLERAKAGEMIEVSVGVFVTTEKRAGTFEGKKFMEVWKEIVPDHLAMLPEGTEGACSNAMGCGAPRAATKKEDILMADEEKKSLWEKIKGLIRSAQDDTSDVELRQKLDDALRLVEPGYLGIEVVIPGESKVIYATAPADIFALFQRTYTEEGGEIKLNEDQEEVIQVTKYEPKVAEATDNKGDETKMADEKIVERVKALIECPKNLFTCDDKAYLEGCSEEKLTALEKAWAEPEPKPPETVTPESLRSKPKELTEEQILALPNAKEVKEIVDTHRAAIKKQKEDLVSNLKAAQSAYSEDDLNSMDISALEKLATAMKLETADYSGLGAPRSTEDEAIPEPPSLAEKIKAN